MAHVDWRDIAKTRLHEPIGEIADNPRKDVLETSEQLLEAERKKLGWKRYTGEVSGLFPESGAAELSELDAHDAQFKGLVEDMFEKLPSETRIIEGTEVPTYTPVIQNGFSNTETTIEQWKSDLQHGSSTTVLTPSSIAGSSTSAFIAELSNRASRIKRFGDPSFISPTASCSPKSDDFGNEIDAMNESSECTVPLISEPTDGTLNEGKWSLRQRFTASSEANPPEKK